MLETQEAGQHNMFKRLLSAQLNNTLIHIRCTVLDSVNIVVYIPSIKANLANLLVSIAALKLTLASSNTANIKLDWVNGYLATVTSISLFY